MEEFKCPLVQERGYKLQNTIEAKKIIVKSVSPLIGYEARDIAMQDRAEVCFTCSAWNACQSMGFAEPAQEGLGELAFKVLGKRKGRKVITKLGGELKYKPSMDVNHTGWIPDSSFE